MGCSLASIIPRFCNIRTQSFVFQMSPTAAGALPDTLGCAMPILVSGFFILYLYNGQRAAQHRGFYKWFFYAFYPGHLLVLGLLRVALLG